MKRLISWLLALTLIFGLVPMSAMAATDVEIGEGGSDVEVDFGELLEPEIPEPQFFELTTNRQMIVIPAGGYAYGTVDITTGATYNVVAFSAVSDNWNIGLFRMFAQAADEGGAYVASLSLEGMTPMTTGGMEELTITYYNASEEEAYITTYLEEIVTEEVVGTWDNPDTLVLGENVAQIAGGTDPYFYNYTAEQDGILTLAIESSVGGWFYTINNMTAGKYGDEVTSVDGANPAEIEVTAGDELQIIVNTYDAANPYEAPAGTVTVNASYKTAEPEYVAPAVTFGTSMQSFLISFN